MRSPFVFVFVLFAGIVIGMCYHIVQSPRTVRAEPAPAIADVTTIQTEEYVTFLYGPITGDPAHTILIVQKAAEQWKGHHLELAVRPHFSTTGWFVPYKGHTYAMTLYLDQK